MNNIFNPIYRKEFMDGYTSGNNPFSKLETSKKEEGFIVGFNKGRSDYEYLNGRVEHGIPNKVLTIKILEDYLLAGMLGMKIDFDEYSEYQLQIIHKWYMSGVEKFDENHYNNLGYVLSQKGIVFL